MKKSEEIKRILVEIINKNLNSIVKDPSNNCHIITYHYCISKLNNDNNNFLIWLILITIECCRKSHLIHMIHLPNLQSWGGVMLWWVGRLPLLSFWSTAERLPATPCGQEEVQVGSHGLSWPFTLFRCPGVGVVLPLVDRNNWGIMESRKV